MSKLLLIVSFIFCHCPREAYAQSNDAFWRDRPPQGLGQYLNPDAKSGSPSTTKSSTSEDPGPIASGIVTEHLLASDFSYIQVKLAEGDLVWVVVYKASVQVGQMIEFSASQQMEHFHSKLLNRDFAKVIFVDKIEIKGGEKKSTAATQKPTPSATQKPKDSPAADQPQNLADLIARRTEFAGKTVEIEGKVTKFNEGILGKNWLHLGGNSADDKDADLVVTSQQKVAVGASIKAKGKITIDESIGSGYNFSILLNDAQITEISQPK